MTDHRIATQNQPQVRSERADKHYAAIDLGTNNCRLMIAAPADHHGININGTFSRLVRLGEGLSETGALSEKAMERTIEALNGCLNRLSYSNIRQIRCIATAACRIATNGAAFLNKVEIETGLKFDILSTEQEAYYAALSCYPLILPNQSHSMVLDIGGGSTEIVGLARGVSSRQPQDIGVHSWHSMPVGVVSLSETFTHMEAASDHFELMKQAVRIQLDASKFDHPLWQNDFELIGTSGTVTMLAGIYMNLPRYSKRRVDGFRFEVNTVKNLITELRHMTWQERSSLGCIGTQRVDLILSGCAILEAILEAFPISTIRVADRGLREGILYEMMYGTVLHTPEGSKGNTA